ncbi:MAG: helix-turn-helix domain-containing protein [Patulibacter sp.]
MLRREYDTQVCSVARSLEVVGERWSLLIVRSVLIGVRRFDHLQHALGVTRSVLTDRLKRLEAEGVIERRQYHERPARYEYHLTPKGRELWPVIHHLMDWGDRHYPNPSGPPTVVTHRDCGGHVSADLHCDRCDATVRPGQVRVAPGPGYDPERSGTWAHVTPGAGEPRAVGRG